MRVPCITYIFQVSKIGLNNLDSTVNMARGKIWGLDTALQRKRDCQAPFVRDKTTIVACKLTLQGLDITLLLWYVT